MNKLYKTRYLLEGWDIDFFRDHADKTYFALAEYEMPEEQESPDFIPDYIKSNLIHEVVLNDCRFSSKMLADVRHASNLYKEISRQSPSAKKAC